MNLSPLIIFGASHYHLFQTCPSSTSGVFVPSHQLALRGYSVTCAAHQDPTSDLAQPSANVHMLVMVNICGLCKTPASMTTRIFIL